MEEWKEYRIGELGRIVTGKTPKTSNKDNYGGDIPFLTPSDDLSSKYAPNTIKKITKLGLNEVKNCLLPPNSVCVSCIGSDLGKVVMLKEPSVTNQQFNSIIPNGEFCPDFIYYLMNIVGKELNFIGKTSTAVPIVNKSSFSNTEVLVPSLPTQQKIANILSSLDDKIEVNRRINEQLEELAGALFKSWFVDFEPFKDGEFVDSELGMIPKGWKIVDLKEFCIEIVRGYTPKYAEFSDYPILNQKVNKGDKLEKQYYKYNKNDDSVPLNKMAQRGDVYLNSLGQGTLGRIHLYKDELSNVIVDQFITILRTNSFIKSAYLASILKSPIYQNEIESRITGSTGMWVLTINNIRNIKIVQPLNSLWQQLENIIEPIYRQIAINEKENEHLTTLRDTLLPKLMSGEIDVNEVKI